ncbi:zinc transporter, ZIP family [Alkalithermobacter thermoalcaliphilus JW-YL-7 = DSM 7308]|uniref:Zinc transporter, ZIP family n=1 Tax=Alkalithermobacter thermoalcaliphilus JW-YL-7 = DSM 7308 TaxID=1121328 RepID=A0A150FP11_CLOPD|nr:zinc/iron permease [[Clostridium] paradoxum JW-YL-7 = DSM 7308]SHK84486.1 zinc transporter, ZIP family [[Clostridium] paradoxum JW-YL-7 = DSM 7308]
MNVFIASIISGLCTGVGAFPIIFIKNLDVKIEDMLLGFAGGVMVFVGAYSLIHPCIEDGHLKQTVIGILLGAIFMYLIEIFMPEDRSRSDLLLVLGHIIHSIPEGLVIGAASEAKGKATGLLLAVAIGVHNMPEGFIICNILNKQNMSKLKAIIYTTLTGLGEPLATGIGIIFLKRIEFLIPFSMAFAGGSVLYIVSNEIIPKTHSRGNEKIATFSFIAGFIFMIVLENIIK